MYRSIAIVLSTVLSVLATGCGSSSDAGGTPSTTATVVAEGSAGSYGVTVLAAAPLATGYNALVVQVRNAAGAQVTDAAVSLVPMMDMGTMQHSAPVGPVAVGADGNHSGFIVFQMASTAATGMGAWTLKVAIQPAGGGAPSEATFPVTVVDGATEQPSSRGAKSFAVGSGTMAVRYVVSMSCTAAQKTGLNPVAVTLHSSTDMGMTFTPVTDATITLDPQMPSMGHGSPGSVNPAHVSSGVYQGQLSYSMPGPWETTVSVTRPGWTTPQTAKITTSW